MHIHSDGHGDTEEGTWPMSGISLSKFSPLCWRDRTRDLVGNRTRDQPYTGTDSHHGNKVRYRCRDYEDSRVHETRHLPTLVSQGGWLEWWFRVNRPISRSSFLEMWKWSLPSTAGVYLKLEKMAPTFQLLAIDSVSPCPEKSFKGRLVRRRAPPILLFCL